VLNPPCGFKDEFKVLPFKLISMNISIFGLGYVGCVSLGCLAQNGHMVIGVDVVESKIKLINQGLPTIIENDIDKIILQQHEVGKIVATSDYRKAVITTDVSIICVGTPSSDSGHLNLNYVYKVAEEIAEGLKNKHGFHVIAIRSTVLPGTNEKVGQIIESVSNNKRNVDFAVVSNPEFLREGSAVVDYFNPPVTVLGGDNEKALNIMEQVYKDINAPIKKVGIKEAEIIKYVNNSFHALKVTFANEVGNICKKLSIDSHAVMELFVMDKQLNLSSYYLKPGFAYGGSCLPKDLKGLNTIAHDKYLESPVLDSIERSNNVQKRIALELVVKSGKKKIGMIGLSFKKGTDDLRYSPSVELIEQLLGKGCQIKVYDKNVNYSKISGTNKEYIDKHIPHITNLITSKMNELQDFAEVVVIVQKDDAIDNEFVKKTENKIIIDLVNIMELHQHTFYNGICW
jgi:GDP-mannose 6-dehydrogenase